MKSKISIVLLLVFLSNVSRSVEPNPSYTMDTPSIIKYNLIADWTFHEAGTKKEYEAIVPGCVHTDLIRNNIISDPFLSTNETACQWVGETDWIYESKPFDCEDHVTDADVIRMRFKGLDTYATVYLNNHIILRADNAHRSWEIDVKQHLKHKNNVLKIEFRSPVKEGEKKLKELPYPLPGEGIRAVTRKPQFHYGWDWGPKLVTCGITDEIEIIAYSVARLTDIYIEQKSVNEKSANVNIRFEIHSVKNQQATLVCSMPETGENWTTEVELKKGMNLVELPIEIAYPYLWWCNDFGKAHQYRFETVLSSEDVVIDKRITKTGLRSIKLVQEKDEIGESFYFKLNDQKVFAKGANYIPIQYYPAQATESDYRKLLSDCRDAHINMLRVWGGGVYEKDIFYDLCDEYGIMVWQDFMFACSMYPADSVFVVNVINEAEEQTKRLRNHPSIALWCGNNENAEGWERWGWQMGLSEKEKSKLWRAYLDIFDLTLGTAVKKYTNTDYWISSPKYGRADKRSYTEGDAHDWGVWHDEDPFETLKTKIPRFMSEFGMQSFPSKEVLAEMMSGHTMSYDDHGVGQHQKHNRGFKLMDKYMERWYPATSHDSLEKYLIMTQAVQAEGIGMGIEAQRRNMPRCMGTLYWQLNDVWPAFSWSGIDYKGNKKLLHKYLHTLYAPQLISPIVENDSLKIYWISDNGMSDEMVQMQIRIVDQNNLFDPADFQKERKFIFAETIENVTLKEGVSVVYDKTIKSIIGKTPPKNLIVEIEMTDPKTGHIKYERMLKLTPESDYRIIPAFSYSAQINTGQKKPNPKQKEIFYYINLDKN